MLQKYVAQIQSFQQFLQGSHTVLHAFPGSVLSAEIATFWKRTEYFRDDKNRINCMRP